MSLKTFLCCAWLCITTPLVAQDLTGVWHDPAVATQGVVIDSNYGNPVGYWFTYPFREEGQTWFIMQPSETDENIWNLWTPEGTFLGATGELGPIRGIASIEEIDDNNIVFSYRFVNWGPCWEVNVSPVWSGCANELRLTRLTRRVQEEQ